jgi:hypothetical protein
MPQGTRTVFAGYVEYRVPTQIGTRVIRVLTGTPTPRVSCWVEKWTPGLEVEPMTIYLDELLTYISDAYGRPFLLERKD